MGWFVFQAAVSLAALAIVVAFFLRLLERREQAWASERASLMNHIQFGDRLPIHPPARRAAPPGGDDEERDEIGLVGTVQAPQERE